MGVRRVAAGVSPAGLQTNRRDACGYGSVVVLIGGMSQRVPFSDRE